MKHFYRKRGKARRAIRERKERIVFRPGHLFDMCVFFEEANSKGFCLFIVIQTASFSFGVDVVSLCHRLPHWCSPENLRLVD